MAKSSTVLPQELVEAVDRLAASRFTSRSAIIRVALVEYLARQAAA